MAIIRNILDKRIKDCADIQSFKRYDDKYIGESGYFSDSLCRFQDLKCCYKYILININDDEEAGDFIFECKGGNYRYFLPEKLVKEPEKKYKVFSLEKFLETFKVGDIVCYREKGSTAIQHKMFTGYVTCTDGRYDVPGIGKVSLGAYTFGLGCLFNNYELFLNNNWQPFGIEE